MTRRSPRAARFGRMMSRAAALLCVSAAALLHAAAPGPRPVEPMDYDDPMVHVLSDREHAKSEGREVESEIWPPPVSRRDVLSLARWAEMDDAQRDAALVLVDEFVRGWNESRWRLDSYRRQVFADAVRPYDEADRSKAVSRAYAALDARDRTELDALARDLDALLTPEQAAFAGWTARRIDARGADGYGSLVGDVIDALESTLRDRPAPPGARELVLSWQRDATRARAPVVEAMHRYGELAAKAADDPALQIEAENAYTKIAVERAGVRDEMESVTRAAVERLVRVLEEDDRPEFELRVMAPSLAERQHRNEPSHIAPLLEVTLRACALDDVDPHVADRLRELRRDVVRRMIEAYREVADRIEAPDAATSTNMLNEVGALVMPDDERWIDELRRVLTPAQLERIGVAANDAPVPLPDFDGVDEPVITFRNERERREYERGLQIARRHYGIYTDPSVVLRLGLSDDEVAAAQDVIETANASRALASRRRAATGVLMNRALEARVYSIDQSEQFETIYQRFMTHVGQATAEMIADLEVIFGEHRAAEMRAVKIAILLMNTDPYADPRVRSVDLRSLLRQTPGADAHARDVEPVLQEFEARVVAILESAAALRRRLDRADTGGQTAAWFEQAWADLDTMSRQTATLSHEFGVRLAPMLKGDARDEFETLLYEAQGFADRWDRRASMSLGDLRRHIERLDGLTNDERAAIDVAWRSGRREHIAAMRDLAARLFNSNNDAARPEADAAWLVFSGGVSEVIELERAAMRRVIETIPPEHRARLAAPYRPWTPIPPPTFD